MMTTLTPHKGRGAILLGLIACACGLTAHGSDSSSPPANVDGPKADKPNILVIWGDDIGMRRTSAPTSHGMMGATKPRTSTGSPKKAPCSPITTASRAARPAARRSSPASTRSAWA